MKNASEIDGSYFITDAVQYAKHQGRAVDNKEFVELFQKHITNLPNSRIIKKKWLEAFINASKEEYTNHTKGKTSECESYCQYTLGYVRGIPHAQAELQKIDPMHLFAEKAVIALKGIPGWLMRKWTLVFKLPIH